MHNTETSDSTWLPFSDGSRWFRFHQAEFTGLRAPFGCEVIFKQSSTKKTFTPGKWDGTGSPGILAGYRMKPGYVWKDEYYVWSLDEMLKVNLATNAASYPIGLRKPHIAQNIRLPDGGAIRFPMKAEYNRLNFTLEGRR